MLSDPYLVLGAHQNRLWYLQEKIGFPVLGNQSCDSAALKKIECVVAIGRSVVMTDSLTD